MTSPTDTIATLERYETAQETLGMMIAIRARWIYEEQQKPAPDASRIARWEVEQRQYTDEHDALQITDGADIERIIATYGPQTKAEFPDAAE